MISLSRNPISPAVKFSWELVISRAKHGADEISSSGLAWFDGAQCSVQNADIGVRPGARTSTHEGTRVAGCAL